MTPGVWIGLVVLILINALYVAAEFGAVGVRRSRVRRMAEDGNRTARVLLPHVQDTTALDQLVGACQIGITLSSLALGAFAQATISPALAPLSAAWFQLEPELALTITAVVVLIVLTSAQLILGELVPKSIALQYPTQTSLATIWPVRWSLWLFRPILALLNGSATLVLRLFGIVAHGHRHLHSPEEIALLLAESRDGGLLEPEEQQRLHRALRLSFKTARDLMVPCDRLTMLEVDAPWTSVLDTVASSPFSRIPVYRSHPSQIIGTLRVKDLVGRYVAEGPSTVTALMRPLVRVAEDLAADRLVQLLRERRAHQAIVVDSQDQTLGLVTIQDVLSEMLEVRRPAAQAAGTPP
ncbi:MAG TPA: hemolysin family protein [Vicinamibacterales bacterium]|nr:hemolysin family protein [Vicinamibacterales bacterium]